MNLETLKPLIEKHGTPLYAYDLRGFRERVRFFKSVLPAHAKIHYAMKANHFADILKVLLEENVGLDVVSSGEMQLGLKSGFSPQKIVFSGVGKTKNEIKAAIEANILQLNIESKPELERIVSLAKKLEVKKPVAVAFRVNPDVKTETHPYIQTGFRENKFGLDFTEIDALLATIKANSSFVRLTGLTLHIGSQIRDLKPFELAIQKSLDLYKQIESKGFQLDTFDVGGGLGMDYGATTSAHDEKLISEYGALLKKILPTSIPQVLLEPGRILVARFGELITEIQYVKRTPFKNFLIVDAGMNHLIRPALYEATHRIDPLVKSDAQKEVFDVVGPICESSDVLGAERYLPGDLKSGDLLKIADAGAYGSVMMSDYNLRPRAYEVSF